MGILLDKQELLSQFPSMPANALSLLEKLTSVPTDASAPQQFWIEGLGSKPKSSRKKSGGDGGVSSDDEGDQATDPKANGEDDWRAFFDDPKPSDASKKPKGKARRIHTMSIHEQLHALAAHRAVFTKCWLTLLPLLARSSEEDDEDQMNLVLVTRALNVLHRGVMPHLTRAVLIMDWVAGCVDYGMSHSHFFFVV